MTTAILLTILYIALSLLLILYGYIKAKEITDFDIGNDWTDDIRDSDLHDKG